MSDDFERVIAEAEAYLRNEAAWLEKPLSERIREAIRRCEVEPPPNEAELRRLHAKIQRLNQRLTARDEAERRGRGESD